MFRSPNTLDDEVERRRGAREESRWGRVCQRAAARLLVAAALLALVGVWVLVTWQKTIMQAALSSASISLLSANITLPSSLPASFHGAGGGSRGWEEWREKAKEGREKGKNVTVTEVVLGFGAEMEVDIGSLGQMRLGISLSLPPWTLRLSFGGCAIGSLSLPPSTLPTPLRPFRSQASLTVLDFPCFDLFVRAMAVEQSVSIRLQGTVSTASTGQA